VVLDLLLIGLGITLEPFPLTAFILMLSAEKGTRKGLAFLLGWLACLVVVIAAAILATGNSPPKPQTVPSTAILAVKLALGVTLILLAMRQRRQMGHPRKPPAWMAHVDRLSLWSAAGGTGISTAAARRPARGSRRQPAFVFPEMANIQYVGPDGVPKFMDYLHLSFTTTTAFSPTDVSAIRPWAKLMMMAEEAISLVVAILVVSRAVNILK